MEQLDISFVLEEGACRRLIGLIEAKGGPITSVNMADISLGSLSRLQVTYAAAACEQRRTALVNRIRTIHGVASVTAGNPPRRHDFDE